jgi:bis(5'-nucleosyl)-tetraphosphatase (symmetrical)
MRWLVGDVHGCARELERLLREIRFDPGRDELWTVGDLVNTGQDSLAVLRMWRDAGGRGVLGNHDVYALLVGTGARRRKADTLEPLFAAPDAAELLEWLRALPVLVHLPAPGLRAPDVWLVHAGLHPGWRDLEATARRMHNGPHDDDWLQGADVDFAVRVRCCTEEGTILRHVGPPEDCPGESRPWDAFYDGSALVVHGHWALRGHYRGARTLGLDSGCVYGGKLTAWCQDEDRIVQV